MQQQYGEELMKAQQKKEMQRQVDDMARKDEYNNMQKNIQLKATLENIEKQQA